MQQHPDSNSDESPDSLDQAVPAFGGPERRSGDERRTGQRRLGPVIPLEPPLEPVEPGDPGEPDSSAEAAPDAPRAQETTVDDDSIQIDLEPEDSGPGEPPPSLTGTTASPRHQLEAWLAIMVQEKASDLILRAGGRPCVRVDSRINFLNGRVPGSGPLLEVLDGIIGTDRMSQWRANGSVDTALHLDGLGRFRLNAYKQMGEPAVVLRRIADNPPDLHELNLPFDELQRLALKKRGILLVTGIAGSGKSTTLAAMIQHMNCNADRHVVTLEDPVEMIFTEKRCVISQREVGTDCSDFQAGLRHALRQSPDAILIGEMRDAETVIAALDATETGHLVMSTLHTVNAGPDPGPDPVVLPGRAAQAGALAPGRQRGRGALAAPPAALLGPRHGPGDRADVVHAPGARAPGGGAHERGLAGHRPGRRERPDQLQPVPARPGHPEPGRPGHGAGGQRPARRADAAPARFPARGATRGRTRGPGDGGTHLRMASGE